MKDKLGLPVELTIRQDRWIETPCSSCGDSPCCVHLPLVSFRITNRADFVNLLLLACYNRIRIGLKKSLEWTIYLYSSCRHLDPHTSKCSIHGMPDQSLVCKTYNAHQCWYKPSFASDANEKIIFMGLDRLLLLDSETGIMQKGEFVPEYSWERLCERCSQVLPGNILIQKRKASEYIKRELPFHECTAERFLFFPPFERPTRTLHLELVKFRLGFPGVSLAVCDNYWAYLVEPELNNQLLKALNQTRFPAIQPRHCCYSFTEQHKERAFVSSTGQQWVLVKKDQLPAVMALSKTDSFGNFLRLPAGEELRQFLASFSPKRPDRAA